jgi:glucan phosphoethanolaminetransferase (alkaline phosphatase superfamily)
MTSTPPPSAQPTSVPVLRRILIYGAVLALGIAVVGAVIGGIVAGVTGVVSALIGTVIAVLFMGITAASILVANRYAGRESAVGAFFGIVMGGWLLKFVLFLVLVIVLKDQPWVQPVVLFLSIIAGVIGSLVVDTVVVLKSRMTYVSDVRLPTAPNNE